MAGDILIVKRPFPINHFIILKTLEKLSKENSSSPFLLKNFVKEYIYKYPEDLRLKFHLTWTSESLDQTFISLETSELIESYITKEKNQKKMIKLSKKGRRLLKDFDVIYKFKF